MHAPFKLGLTGGIGAGKSTVARLLVEGGGVLVDADALSRATTMAGGAAMPAIRAHFGVAVISADGALDRTAMRALVFSDPSARQQLEAIVHPLVHQAIEDATARAGHQRWLVLDIPLLVESRRWPAQLDQVMVVDCRIETQIARVQARSKLPADEVWRIIGAQATRAQRLAAADIVLYNDEKSIDTIRREVACLARHFGL